MTNQTRPTLLRGLSRRFSPRKTRVGADGRTPLAGGTGSRTVYLLGRELCLFVAVDASRVPVRQRPAFVQLAVRHAAPYQDPDFDCAWVGDQAAVWYWSKSRATALLGEHQAPSGAHMLAESSHLGMVRTNAIELLELAHGVEARIWRERRLLASRWWPEPPNATAWQAFVRGAGLPMTTAMPSSEPTQIGARWSERGTGGSALGRLELEQHLPRATLAVGASALALFCWQLGTGVRAGYDAWQAGSQIQGLDASLTKILDARSAADAARTEIETLLALRQGVPQHYLLAEAARLTQENAARLQLWQQPHPDRIEATLVTSQPNAEAIVQAWEASPFFSDVNVELGRLKDTLVVRATIVDGRRAEAVAP